VGHEWFSVTPGEQADLAKGIELLKPLVDP